MGATDGLVIDLPNMMAPCVLNTLSIRYHFGIRIEGRNEIIMAAPHTNRDQHHLTYKILVRPPGTGFTSLL